MECIDKSFETAEENIAFDEELLMGAEQGRRGKMLRFWEQIGYAVVLGKGSCLSEDVYLEKCKKDKVKILKRASGGGAVVLGKGCLNYSAILPYSIEQSLQNIKSSYNFLLGKIADAFCKKGINLRHMPLSDLAAADKKVSGNAQARKRKFLLQHGTFLYDFDIDRISFYIRQPKKMPEYRKGRKHKNFLANLPLPAFFIKETIKVGLKELFE